MFPLIPDDGLRMSLNVE